MASDLIKYDSSESRKLGKTSLILLGTGALGWLITPWIGVPLVAAGGIYGFRWYVRSMAEKGKRL